MFQLLLRTTTPWVFLWIATVASLSPDPCPNGSISTSVQFHPKTFTPAETRAIIELMKSTLPVEFDERIDKSVRRTNYFDQGLSVTSPDSKYRWILERIHPLYAPPDQQSMETFVSNIDFILLHEFDKDGFFDWHVDTKPGDGTGRTNNINVMLTDRSDYDGGTLTVGVQTISAQQGDCYWYPAALPHRVSDITRNQRHTLIIAMKDTLEVESERNEYWAVAEENHKSICTLNPTESKLHMLYGEFLAALGRPDEQVDAKFADMYASTPEANQYVSSFLQQGEQLKQLGKTRESRGYFSMAAMIQSRMSKFETK